MCGEFKLVKIKRYYMYKLVCVKFIFELLISVMLYYVYDKLIVEKFCFF